MIEFKDFFPEILEKQNFPGDDKYETFSSLLARVNQWLEAETVKLINVETVVLRDRDGERTCFLAEEPFFYQFIRVWYQVQEEMNPDS